MSKPILVVEDIKKYFPIKKGFFQRVKGHVKAVDGISLSIKKGETFGLVGESGCGKSTLGRVILNLIHPSAGNVMFEDKNLTLLEGKDRRAIRKDIQIIFQDPYASLDPRMKIKQIIAEPIKTHRLIQNKEEMDQEIARLIQLVGLNESHLNRYPHQLSGGQRQRIGIARALALKPKLIVADESVSALDVSIQSQILNLLNELKEKLDLTIVFISHDLSVVKHISDTVGVMYLGKMVEVAPKKLLYSDAFHPYTQALLSSVPVADPLLKREKIVLEGDIPDPSNPPTGCAFCPRCPQRMDMCSEVTPTLHEIEDNHFVACHLYDESLR